MYILLINIADAVYHDTIGFGHFEQSRVSSALDHPCFVSVREMTFNDDGHVNAPSFEAITSVSIHLSELPNS